ncbi:MAG: YciI family protein [Planctomycetota bacterium]
MKYMLMMHHAGEGPAITTWPTQDIQRHIQFMIDLNARLAQAGELLDAQGLAFPAEAKVVRAGKDGGALVFDGPFAESKEFLAGFWIVSVPSEARAIAIAAEASAAPGLGGVRMSIPIELRQVMEAPDV